MGLVQVKATTEELVNLEEVFVTWGAEPSETVDVHTLEMKNNMKELNPKTFGTKEKQAFDEADAAEWKQWLISGAVVLVPASQESGIRKDQIFSAPMRFVRTNKAKESGHLQAKSRLIIPGHRDPQFGLYRTDAPTTSGLAVMVVATIAAAQGWFIRFFDVMTAFLSGKAIGRTVFIRGLAGCERQTSGEAVPADAGLEGCLRLDGGAEALVLAGSGVAGGNWFC